MLKLRCIEKLLALLLLMWSCGYLIMTDDKFWCYVEPVVFAHGHKNSNSAEFLLRQFENKILKTVWRENYPPYKVASKADLRKASEHKVHEFSVWAIS